MQAKKYNVSPKTIRDILNRRTWTKETRHLWAQDEQASIRTPKIKTVERLARANSSYQTNGTAPAVLDGDQHAYQPFDDGENCTDFQLDEKMSSDLNTPDPLTSSTTSSVFTTAAVFLPEACHLGSAEAGTSDDPFHFDWPHW
jgi:hypothetical protein